MIAIFSIIFCVCIVGFAMSINAQKARKIQDKPIPTEMDYRKSWEKFNEGRRDKCSHARSRTYYEYPIVGMKYRKLPDYQFECFCTGYLRHDKRNKHDDMAIGVYDEEGCCVGYIPSPENIEIYVAMQEDGIEKVDVLGSIEKNYDSGKMRWIGRVYIDTEDLNLPEE